MVVRHGIFDSINDDWGVNDTEVEGVGLRRSSDGKNPTHLKIQHVTRRYCGLRAVVEVEGIVSADSIPISPDLYRRRVRNKARERKNRRDCDGGQRSDSQSQKTFSFHRRSLSSEILFKDSKGGF